MRWPSLRAMTRVLDIDLDFFVRGVRHFVDLDDLTRPDPAEYAVWSIDEALQFLQTRCGLSRPLPGWAIERHGEAFRIWGNGLAAGTLRGPLSVTHVDAHADLGLGEAAHVEIMTKLMHMSPGSRAEHATRVSDGSYLAYACACEWVSDLTYVHSDEGGRDLHTFHLKGWHPSADALQFKALTASQLDNVTRLERPERPATHLGPEIPFRHMNWRSYTADEPFDVIVVCRSPNFTPITADPLYDRICSRFLRQVNPPSDVA